MDGTSGQDSMIEVKGKRKAQIVMNVFVSLSCVQPNWEEIHFQSRHMLEHDKDNVSIDLSQLRTMTANSGKAEQHLEIKITKGM